MQQQYRWCLLHTQALDSINELVALEAHVEECYRQTTAAISMDGGSEPVLIVFVQNDWLGEGFKCAPDAADAPHLNRQV
jgi:hypothetical protein